jgi:adsorption protein B
MEWVDFIAYGLVFAKILLIVVGVIFFISGIDDLFIDLYYLIRAAYRRLFIKPKFPKRSEERLKSEPEKPLAVMIPAWQESAVIRPMLENTLRSLHYSNFRIFVGTYPNDPDTLREVDLVREKCDRVERIVCPHEGPTNKADCLNWVYQGIKLYEKLHGVQFEIFVMQDCEDIIHPLCYKLFNFLIPRKDMVQLPVMALEPRWYQFTPGHYIDEFAQLHYKDMVVRESLNHSIPAAGVGCAFSRRAFEVVAKSSHNQLFSVDSLTEDYDMGFRMREHGLKQVFVKFPVTRVASRRNFLTGRERPVAVDDMVCIREYFPVRFKAAMRQKSRWVVGIALQGWANLGWLDGVWTRYMLYRDRKSLVTNLMTLLGYVLVAVVVTVWTVTWVNPDAYRFPPLLEQGTWLWYLVLANAALLVWRMGFRAYCVFRLYGVAQALLSLPRMVWGNVVNFAATCRAIVLYLRYLRTGDLIAWDKTAHSYPSEKELTSYHRKIGDLLLERRLVTVTQLTQALDQQKSNARRLGEILTDMGALEDNELARVLQTQ